LKAFLNINEVLACIMTNWLSANIVTWAFDVTKFKNIIEGTKTGYIYKTSYGLTQVGDTMTYVDGAGATTPKLGLDLIFPGSQVNAGIIIAIIFAVLVFILLNKTTLGYELKACGANRHAARYAGINDKRNIVLSMAISGALAAGGAGLYWLSGNTEFFWSTYQSLPATGFNGIPVALLAVNNPVGVVFSGVFMAMLDIVGQNLTGFTAYNEYITDVIISVIVYLSAFALVVRMWLFDRKKKRAAVSVPAPAPEPIPEPTAEADTQEGGDAQ
jgi:simple sugar transport system permease protein